MADIIKADKSLMEDMIRVFIAGAGQLGDTTREMQSIASTLEDGALLGRGGDSFVEAIQGRLVPAITTLQRKFYEMARDVTYAKNQIFEEADPTAAGLFD